MHVFRITEGLQIPYLFESEANMDFLEITSAALDQLSSGDEVIVTPYMQARLASSVNVFKVSGVIRPPASTVTLVQITVRGAPFPLYVAEISHYRNTGAPVNSADNREGWQKRRDANLQKMFSRHG